MGKLVFVGQNQSLRRQLEEVARSSALELITRTYRVVMEDGEVFVET